jgi:histidyl-tRNA synthetase
MKAQMRDANRCGAKTVIILGEEEIKKDVIQIKNMSSGAQEEISINKTTQYINNSL